MANHNLGTIRGTIEIDYDGAGIVRAVKDSDNAKKSLAKLDTASSKVLSTFGTFAKGAAATASAIGLLNNAAAIVAGTIATIAPIAAAAFAAAPGIVLSFVGALAVAKVALFGVGDALSNAATGGKKFEEAMEKLSPEAKKFVKAYQAVLPQLAKYRHAVQDAFFNGTAGQVKLIVGRLQGLVPIASKIAGNMGQMAAQIVRVVTNSANMNRIKTILDGVNVFLIKIKGSIAPVVTAFLGLAAQASGFSDTLGGSVANALATFADWLSKIDLKALFETAMPIIRSLGAFFADLVVIAQQLFSIFVTDGAGAAGVLASLADQLAKFLQSAQGQAALDALGQAMQAIGGAAGQIFLALLQALAPTIVALAPGLALLATQISGALVPAINMLAPLLESVAGFLSANMSWLGPVAGAVVAVAIGYKAYAAAAKAVVAVQTVMKAQIIATAAAWVASTAALVANRVAMIASAAASLAVRAATAAWVAVQWLLNAALAANPIGIVVLAIAALVAGIIYAWKNSETFRAVVLTAWDAIKASTMALWGVIKMVFNAIVSAIGAAMNWITGTTRSVWNAIVSFVRGTLNTYRSIIMAAVNFIRTNWNNFLRGLQIIARQVWSAITSFIQGQINKVKTVIRGVQVVVGIVRNAFNSAKNAAVSAISSLLSTVRGIPGRVRSALGGLARLLYGKGQDLIRGFINGIGSMIGAVRAKVSSVVSAVTRFLPGSPAKEGPLSGRGYVLYRARRFMQDFAQGIADGSESPTVALAGAVNPLARAVVPSAAGTSSGASSTPSTPAVAGGTRTYQIGIDGKVIADLVVDAITGNPVTVKKAADEGGRQRSWAGSGRK